MALRKKEYNRKKDYNKRFTSLEEQINILKSHGLIINDEENAKKILRAIGNYRLGFYLYPFELTYPYLDARRKHKLKENIKIEDAEALYYFDVDLRNILNQYISMIEIALRNTIIYELSSKYKHNPFWFVDNKVISRSFILNFESAAYSSIRKHLPIQRHHKKYKGHYAPAWKTIEYLTLGNIESLYDSLLLDNDKKLISNQFGEPATATFKSYLSAIREVRNACAHGNMVFGIKLSSGIRSGAACNSFPGNTNQTFHGALRVIDFMLSAISESNRLKMWDQLREAAKILFNKCAHVKEYIEGETGILV